MKPTADNFIFFLFVLEFHVEDSTCTTKFVCFPIKIDFFEKQTSKLAIYNTGAQ